MAKPKGGTLSALFAVSEQERRQFYDRIQQKIATDPSRPRPILRTPPFDLPPLSRQM